MIKEKDKNMNDVILYTDSNGEVKLEVSFADESVWLTQQQISELFSKDRTVITRHINNIFKDGEIDKKSNVQKMHFAHSDRPVTLYSLDVILSIGYRTSSKRAIEFRQWASKILKEYLVKGYALNQKRIEQQSLNELTQTIEFIKNSLEHKEISTDETKGLLGIINNYAKSWALLQRYDEDSLELQHTAKKTDFILEYNEVKIAISSLKEELIKKGEATELFGNQKANELEGIIYNIYQTFGGEDLLPSLEEKAANLFYYIIKDHPFSDGNKRIGSFLFILFLQNSGLMFKENAQLKINDNALVALALLVASSDPKQKELMIKLIVNLLCE